VKHKSDWKKFHLGLKVKAPPGMSGREVCRLVNRLIDSGWEEARIITEEPDVEEDDPAIKAYSLVISKPKILKE